MAETLTAPSRPDSEPEAEVTTPERPDNRQLSPTADALKRAANFLEERAMNKAHETALDEYRDTNRDAYAEHIQKLTKATDEEGNPIDAQREYATNRLTEERNDAHDEALKEYRQNDHSDYVDHLAKLADGSNDNKSARKYGQKELNRENRRESRAELMEKTRTTLRRFGRSAMNRLRSVSRDALLIPLGYGLAAGEAIQSRREARAARKETAKANKAARKAARQAEREQARANKDAERERTKNERREEALRRASAAAERKRGRKARRAERREKVFNYGKTQKARIGRFGRRTRAAGSAFKEAWKNYEETV